MEWIKCNDKLPELDVQVLCFDPNHTESKIYVVKLQKENFYEVDKCKLGHPQQWIEASGESYFTWKPTHWMPLPSPPIKIALGKHDFPISNISTEYPNGVD